MLHYTCLFFAIPSLLGFIAPFYYTAIGCAVLTTTSMLYYHTGHKIPQAIDTIYAKTYTLASTLLGAYFVITKRCPYNALGVACSVIATYIYLTKSKKGDSDVNDYWHAFVHFFGATGFVAMTLGFM